MHYRILISFIGILLFTGIGCTDEKPDPDNTKSEINILFVGNSFTFYNSGVDFHLKKMLEADLNTDSVSYNIQKVAVSSYTLENHYNDSVSIHKIKDTKWDYVILQEQSTRPVNNPEKFTEYASKLNEIIKTNGSKTVLFMTWAQKETPGEILQLASAYNQLNVTLGSTLVPVGLVWDYFVKSYPTYNLYFTDNKHPSLNGTFIIACIFYNRLFNKNPVNNTYIPSGLPVENTIATRKIVPEYFALDDFE